MREKVEARLAEVERKLKARRGVAGYERNVEALEAVVGELKRILEEEQNNV